MSIHARLAAIADELHLTGYGHDFNTAVSKIAHFFADEMHALTGAAPADVGEKIEQLVVDKLNSLEPYIKGELERIEASIDERVRALFEKLLANAAAAAPVAATVAAAAAEPAAADTPPEAAAAV